MSSYSFYNHDMVVWLAHTRRKNHRRKKKKRISLDMNRLYTRLYYTLNDSIAQCDRLRTNWFSSQFQVMPRLLSMNSTTSKVVNRTGRGGGGGITHSTSTTSTSTVHIPGDLYLCDYDHCTVAFAYNNPDVYQCPQCRSLFCTRHDVPIPVFEN